MIDTAINSTPINFEEHKPHILVIDDEPFNRRLLHRLLGQAFEVIEAENGYVALDLIQQHSFDLVVLDIMMPGIHGLDVLTEIRKSASKHELPVILITALHENDDIVRGLKAGANDYIPKPIDAEVVLARVTTQLQLKSTFDLQSQALNELHQTNVLKNTLLSIASHDLKSPLSSIYMAEQLLRQLVDKDDETIVSVLDTLKVTAHNMNAIIVEFLDMAMLQSGQMTTQIEPIELDEVLYTVANQYQLQSEEKGSHITLVNAEGRVLADSQRITQILGNLTSNALKYSPPGSEIKLNIIQHTDHSEIQVIDQGPGIPANERHKLFTEFGKLSTRPTGEESSTGLGLWIVKQMTDLMNGEVGVDCPDDGGSIFWVKLPNA